MNIVISIQLNVVDRGSQLIVCVFRERIRQQRSLPEIVVRIPWTISRVLYIVLRTTVRFRSIQRPTPHNNDRYLNHMLHANQFMRHHRKY